MIRITIPGEPRGKGRPRFGRGRTFTDPKTKAYESDVGLFGKIAMRGKRPLEGALKVRIDAYFTIPRSWSKKKTSAAMDGALRPTGKPDADNLAKVVDGLNKVTWVDDAQIVEMTVTKRYAIEEPRLEIVVETLDEESLGPQR